jgi:hypothetical protein
MNHKEEQVLQVIQTQGNLTQQMMLKAPSKLKSYLSEYCNQTMSCHLPTVFQQKSISAD